MSREAHAQLALEIAGFYDDPLGYVMFNWPWTTDPSIQQVPLQEPWKSRYGCEYGPDKWACEFLEELGREIKKRGFDGRKAVPPIRFATKSGHGIGKSALTAWVIKFIMDTRPFSVGTVTAATINQLRNKTWAQLGYWHSKSLTVQWFEFTSGHGNMALTSQLVPREQQEFWRVTGQTCKEDNSEAFAGQHAAQATSFYVFDEASGVPDKIYEVREGGLTDGEPMVFDFGNPTQPTGRFYRETEGDLARRYIVRSIDSREVYITNKALIQEWINDYGEDSDFVRVRVRGLHPVHGSMQFMSSAEVDAAMKRDTPALDYRSDPLVIGVDCARFGDDESVIYPRIGRDARTFAPSPGHGRFRSIDTVQLTGRIVAKVKEFRGMGLEVAMIFVDEGSFGAAVVDNLRCLGHPVMGVGFGRTATESETYRYVVDEIWGRLRDDLPLLALPEPGTRTGADLRDQLTQREFGYTTQGDKIRLETKDVMKARLGSDTGSPDIADALACTYFQEVVAVPALTKAGLLGQDDRAWDYDPHAANW